MANTPEYHHFIPKFIIKNYAQEFICPIPDCRGKKARHKHAKGKHPKDLVVNHVNLRSEPFELDQAPVRRIFGVPNMYTDSRKTTTKQQRRVETMLGVMESQASTIFRKITKAYEERQPEVVLTRVERNLIRKFLFLLKYRGSTFHRRFYHDNAQGYDANDRNLLREYMQKKGFKTPMEVWFHSIEAIINLEMDAGMKWADTIRGNMYPDDAEWFFSHAQRSYMAICTPSDMTAEFILTDNAYNVFEGPSTFVQDAKTGKCVGGPHGSFHEFAPISPKLMIVFRSRLLPLPVEDYDPEARQERAEQWWAAFGEPFGAHVKSMLDDLPIALARNSYSEMRTGGLFFRQDYKGTLGDDDRFYFSFFPITTDHVRTINGIFLDNAYRGSAIAFSSPTAFSETLDWFMGEPCRVGKVITGPDAGPQLQYLKKLEALAHEMGSTTAATWKELPNPIIEDAERFEATYEEYSRLLQAMRSQRTANNPLGEFFGRYRKIAGDTSTNFSDDMAQAKVMLHFEIWSESFEDEDQMLTKERLLIAYMQLPPSQIWLYLKRVRHLDCGHSDEDLSMAEFFANPEIREGPEDKLISVIPLVKGSVLNRLMYETVMNDLTSRQPWFNLPCLTADFTPSSSLLPLLFCYHNGGLPVRTKAKAML
ncbi:hypothetical protein B0I35DRAFT_440722 [Stachybotrys elegans]|uniref:Uncharacterized protein n=1 Tax=Stachybotrys elegans TaxID=80388 RepID=A0A8K0SEM4_9HYPO|nr:hypothetical protein B0I35DRAFT_440722 [Stachybotrys elegans]